MGFKHLFPCRQIVLKDTVMVKKMLLKISGKLKKEKHLRCRFSGLQLYFKETATHIFSSEICETFKNTYIEEHRQTAASEQCHKRYFSAFIINFEQVFVYRVCLA